MLILGLDPNTFCTGYSIYNTKTKEWDSGVLKLKHSQWDKYSVIDRASEQRKMLEAIIGERKIEHIVIEDVYSGVNPQGGLKIALVSGILAGGLSETLEQIPYLTWCRLALGKGVKNEPLAVDVAGEAVGKDLTMKEIDEACAICIVLAIFNRSEVN